MNAGLFVCACFCVQVLGLMPHSAGTGQGHSSDALPPVNNHPSASVGASSGHPTAAARARDDRPSAHSGRTSGAGSEEPSLNHRSDQTYAHSGRTTGAESDPGLTHGAQPKPLGLLASLLGMSEEGRVKMSRILHTGGRHVCWAPVPQFGWEK